MSAKEQKSKLRTNRKTRAITTNIERINQIKINPTLDKHKKVPAEKDYTVSVPKKFKFCENRILLIGSPNVGKSTFFNHMSSSVAGVSNIDRMTVSTNWGFIKKTDHWVLVDLPGLYNLSHPIEEELVVADMMMNGDWKTISNIIGAPSIERDLYLSLQAAETGKLSSILINMIDEVNGSTLDQKMISKAFGKIPVYKIQASRQKKRPNIINQKLCKANVLTYSEDIEQYISELSSFLPKLNVSKRFLALMILEKNQYILQYLQHHYPEEYRTVQRFYKKKGVKDLPGRIRSERLAFIQNLLKKAIVVTPHKQYLKTNVEKQRKFDHVFLNKWLGIPLIILLVLLIYYISFGPYMGGSLQSLLCDKFLNGIVADKWLHALFFDVFKAGTWFSNFMIDGLFKGLFTVISFIPPIFILFFLINLINQVGLVSRISVLLDQTFNKFGLSGRSIVNLMTGFGCNVPAVMMARSSNSRKERVVSILITPFITCSARAIVFSFVCRAMFGDALGWLAVVLLMFFSGLIALLLGLIFSKTMFRKQKSFFLIEMVNWRKPDFRVIFKNVWLELKDFIKKAATIIILVNLIVWLFLHLGPHGTITDETKIDSSFIGYMGRYLNYIFFPMGGNSSYGWVGNPQGWKMCTSLIAAFPAKEIALTNLTLMFPNDGLSAFLSSQIPIGLSYLIILSFYLPCAATMVMVKKEGGWKNLGIHLASSITTSYVLGLIFYWIAYLCVAL